MEGFPKGSGSSAVYINKSSWMGSLVDLPRGDDIFFESERKLWSLPHGRGSKDHFGGKK